MILKDFGQALALHYYRIKSSLQHQRDVINIVESLQAASKVLICAPDEPEAFGALLDILSRFQNSFPEAQITLLKNSALQVTGSIASTITVIEYDPKQSTIFGPPPRLLSIIQDYHFDMAIDASHSFQLIHTALIIASRAKLRVCFDHPKREELYNFIIRLEPNQKYINSYNILLRYLGAK
jgi:hypothetical protein